MKYLIICLFLTGCSSMMERRVPFKESNRNKQLKTCVNEFIDKSIGVDASIDLCERIYKTIK